jgi:hypothetical protein
VIAKKCAPTSVLRSESFGAFIEHDDDCAIFGSQLFGGVGQDAIELLRRGGRFGPRYKRD